MNTRSWLLVAFFTLSFLFGACDVWFEGARGLSKQLLLWVPMITLAAIIFAWVHADSAQRSYARSMLLNMGIVGLSLVFVPVYLYKSRPEGARAKALGAFALVLLGYATVTFAGAWLAYRIEP